MSADFVSIVARPQLEAMKALALRAPLGDFVEVGVFHGGSASYLYEVTQAQGRTLHLFDTFTGTPFHAEGLDRHKIDGEFAAVAAPARIRELMPAAKLYIGIYPDTHPQDLRDLAFIHCDCDQYMSYRYVIRKMWPLLVHGGILLFDDYPYLAGAKRAVEECFVSEELKTCGARNYVVKRAGRIFPHA